VSLPQIKAQTTQHHVGGGYEESASSSSSSSSSSSREQVHVDVPDNRESMPFRLKLPFCDEETSLQIPQVSPQSFPHETSLHVKSVLRDFSNPIVNSRLRTFRLVLLQMDSNALDQATK
jgi:hypothetical protein